MTKPEQYDAVVLGSGEGGKYLALAPGECRSANGGGRTPVDRRLVSEHQLPSEQERDLERGRRAHSVARRCVRRK